MKISFNVDELLPIISQCTSVVNSKSTLPILSNLLFETKNDNYGGISLLITACDSETWLTMKASLIDGDENMRFCVNANDIYKALVNLKGENVLMSINENNYVVSCEYSNGHFQLPYESADGFPKTTVVTGDVTKMDLDAKHFLSALNQTGFAVANDELRLVMNGVHFDFFDDGMVAVASDGCRLAKLKDMTIRCASENGVNGFTLPKKPYNVITNILANTIGNVQLSFDNRVATFGNDCFLLTTRLIEGRFPNYEAVIPKDNNICINVNRNEFVSALKRVLPMSNNTSELVSLKFTPQMLNIGAVDFDFSKSANESLSCDYNGSEMVVGFKGSMLLSILQNIDCDGVSMRFQSPQRAALFIPSSQGENTIYTSLLMPMLVQ